MAQTYSTANKAHAFSREIYAGVGQPAIDLSGKEINSSTITKEYYIFMEKNIRDIICIKNVWINNECFTVKTGTVKSPVTIPVEASVNNNSLTDTLFTSSNVILTIAPLAKVKRNVPGVFRKTLTQNEVLIEYTKNKRTYYTTIRNMTALHPLSRQ